MTPPRDSDRPTFRSRWRDAMGRHTGESERADPPTEAGTSAAEDSRWRVPDEAGDPATTVLATRAGEQPSSAWLLPGATATLEPEPGPALEPGPAAPAPRPARVSASEWLPGGSTQASQLPAHQRLAVHAYCRELCGEDAAPLAAEQAVRSVSSSAPADEQQLLRATRIAAAAHAAAVQPGAPGWRSRFVDALSAEHEVNCRRVPSLLAQRANGELDRGETEALQDHLGQCLRCRGAEVRADRAERAFLAAGAGTALATVEAAAAGEAPAAPASEDWAVAATMVVPAAAAAGAAPAVTSPGAAVASPARRSRLRPLGAVAVLLLIAGIAVAGIAIANGGKTSSPGASTPSVAATPSTSTTAHRAHATRAHRARAATHRKRSRPHHAAKATSTVAAAPAPAATATTPVLSSSPAVQTPAQPVSQPPAPPPAASPAPTISISQQSLGSAPARTQGLGGGKH